MGARRKIERTSKWDAMTMPPVFPASEEHWRAMNIYNVLAAWEQSARTGKLSQRTTYSYARHLRQLCDWLQLQQLHLLDLTHVELQVYVDWCQSDIRRVVDGRDGELYESKLEAATIKPMLASIRHLYRWLRMRLPELRDPTELIERPRVEHEVGEVLTREELSALLHHSGGSERERIQCWMLAYTGMRVHELCGLRWTDIDLRNGVIHVNGKGNKHRVVDILLPLRREIETYDRWQQKWAAAIPAADDALRDPERQWVLMTRGGKAQPTTTVWRALKARGARAGVRALPEARQERERTDGGRKPKLVDMRSEITPHMLRRTFGTMLLETAPIDAVSDILGHASVDTTRKHYLNPRDERRTAVMRSLKIS